MKRLSGKVAVITGGGQGIGLSIARAYGLEGASIFLTGRDPSKLEFAVNQLRSLGAKAEFRAGTAGLRADAEGAISDAVKHFGRIDMLINNAHTQMVGDPVESVDDEALEANIRSGLFGTIHHMQAAFPFLRERGGAIINMGSLSGIYGVPGFAAYAATKEAIRGLTRVAAREWGQYEIRVNVLCPLALTATAAEYIAKHRTDTQASLKKTAFGRMGDPDEDIAPIAVFLASDDSKFLTGQTINADGGQIML